MAAATHEPTTSAPGVTRIDHFVIQVNDLWRAYEFYRDVLGAEADQIAGMDTERLRHRGNQIVFMRIAGHAGVGLAVSNVAVPPATRPFEHVTQGYEVSARQLGEIQKRLEQRSVAFHGPEELADGPIARRLWFQDPEGHTIEVCVRRHSTLDEVASSRPTPGRISHIGVEVTDVARAARWFEDTLGFEPAGQQAGATLLRIVDGDQMLALRPTDALSPRRDFVRGPHVDFETPLAAYHTLVDRIPAIEGYFEDAPHPFPNPRGVDPEVTVYFCDPDGNRFQLSPSGGH
jgi:catechol 2,3-dioxygenase-like lactoylglutathione lyase family enzyme